MGKTAMGEDEASAPPLMDAETTAPIEMEVLIDFHLDEDAPREQLRMAPSAQDDGEQDGPMLAMCQICLDCFGTRDIVRNICGSTCVAEVCASCLVQHLTATVYSFYPGVLPKVRCPACMTLLNKAQWSKYVQPQESAESDADDDGWQNDHSHVLDKFETLCRQSCGFQSPCCHDTEYTMLPPAMTEEDEDNESTTVQLPCEQAAEIPALRQRYQAYCRHRLTPSEFYEYMQRTFGENAETIFELVLLRVLDDERRAALMLYHLFLKPNTYTLCCEHPVCFKCKAASHHDGKCDDFVQDESVLDCPGCHVTLVKVDGCDAVVCLCGYTIEWPVEMEKQRLQRKRLAPADNAEYQQWRLWATHLDYCLDRIDALEATWRDIRLQRVVQQHRAALLRFVQRASRRARLHLIVQQYRESLRKLVRKRFPHLQVKAIPITLHQPCAEPRTDACSTPRFAAAA